MGSKCTSKIEEKKYLLKLLGNKILVTSLLYSGTIHGWNPKEDFHSRCDNKGPTITLMNVEENGDCIGGYTNL
jgi:hypothetical protein